MSDTFCDLTRSVVESRTYARFWLAYFVFVGLFLVVELIAIHNNLKKDTFSEFIFTVQKEWPMGPFIRWMLFCFLQWVAFHFVTNGKV